MGASGWEDENSYQHDECMSVLTVTSWADTQPGAWHTCFMAALVMAVEAAASWEDSCS
jgi:hypothetical protein